MARNRNFPLVDENGLHLDWVEIHNPTSHAVPLGSFTLTDDLRTPDQYVFPADRALAPGAWVVVFLVTNSDIAALESGAFDGVPRPFRQGPFHARFGLSASAETLWLLGDGGKRVVDRIEVHQLASDITAGRYPDGGPEFGPIYTPTPGAANRRVGVAPVRWLRLPRSSAPLADGTIPIVFEVEQDAEATVDVPDVLVEVAELDGACDLTQETGFEALSVELVDMAERDATGPCADPPPLPGEIDPDDGCRRDSHGSVMPLTVRSVRYQSFLPARPPEECGTAVLYRVIVDDGIAILESQPICYTYCAVEPSVVVNEYQPRNQRTLYFVCETCDESDCTRCLEDPNCPECPDLDCDECIDAPGIGPRRVRTPDWLEIYNYGDEEIDLTGYSVRGKTSDWFFGPDTMFEGDLDESMTRIGPDEFRLILAEDDRGDRRRVYRRLIQNGVGQLVPDMTQRYWSTRFTLNPSKSGTAADVFSLVAASGEVIDHVVLDFTRYAQEEGLDREDDNFLADRSVGRFPDTDPEIPPGATGRDRYPPDRLQPGMVTECPTPGAENATLCDVPPSFALEAVAFPRTPLAGEPVVVRTRLFVDADAGADFTVEVNHDDGEGIAGTLDRTSGVVVTSISATDAPPGTNAFEVSAEIPGRPAGRIVEFAFGASVTLETSSGPQMIEATLDEESARAAGAEDLSFVYAVAPPADASLVRFNEIVPRNRSVSIPGLAAIQHPDYVEIAVPAAGEALDLTGWFLTEETQSESASTPIRRPRLWPFPPGTTVLPGEFLVVAFGTTSASSDPLTIVAGDLVDLSCEGETLYLIGPDAEGNPVAGVLSWWGTDRPSCAVDELGRSPADDAAFGRFCNGDVLRRLTAPSPGAANSLPPLFAGMSHADLISGAPNPCAAPGSFIRVQAEFLIDQALPQGAEVVDARLEFEDGSVLRPASLRGGALPDGYPARFDVPSVCASPARRPACYRSLGFVELFQVPDAPVTRYRLVVEDSCGGILEPCPPGEFCFSIGSANAPARPEIVINEINRLSALPGSSDPRRHWIELYNPSAAAVDLSGASLSNDPRVPQLAPIPAGTVVPPGGFLVVVTDGRPLTSPDATPHVVVDLPWAQFFIGEDRRCRLRGDLLLYGDVESGSCLLARFPFEYPNVAPDETSCGRPGDPDFLPNCTTCDAVSLGRAVDGGDEIVLLAAPSPGLPNESGGGDASFVRGDATGNLRVAIDDAVRVLGFLFGGEGTHSCLDALDADDSGKVDVSDPVYILRYLFRDGAAPPAPFPDPGADPTADELDCVSVGL